MYTLFIWCLMVLSGLASTASEGFQLIENGPTAQITRENGLEKAQDFFISTDGYVYVIQKTHPGVIKFDMQGNKLGEILRPDAGFGKPISIEPLETGFVVADVDANQIHFFIGDTFARSVYLKPPLSAHNLAVIGGRIFCSGFGYAEFSGGLAILDNSGVLEKQFVPDIDPSPYESDGNSLWTRIVMGPLRGDRLLMGFLFQARAYILNRDGDVIGGGDLREHYAEYAAEGESVGAPSGYAAISFCAAPETGILIAVCDNEARQCGRLLLFDENLNKKLGEHDLGYHIWKMKYFQHNKILAVIDGYARILFYRAG